MDQYHENVIKKGDLASSDLGTLADDTKTSEDIRKVSYGPGSVNLLFPPKDVDILGFPFAGSHTITDPYNLAFDFVSRAVNQANSIGVYPVSLTNVLSMSDIDVKEVVPAAKKGLYDGAAHFGIWIPTGETAGMGNRVTVPFNISGLVLCYARRGKFRYGVHQGNGFQFAVSPHNDKGIYQNSDGNGTKIEFNEREHSAGLPFAESFVQDGTAMTHDDTIKINANIIQDGRVLELKSYNSGICDAVQAEIDRLTKETGISFLLSISIVGDRIDGYGLYPMNLESSVVSLVDESTIKNLPKPSEGDTVIGFYNKACRNLRCNGFTDHRKSLVKERGDDWHIGSTLLLKSVAAPATVFNPFFRELFYLGRVTKVGHFSGGAFEGKFAKPLGSCGLGADLSINGHSFAVQDYLKEIQGKDLETICRKQPYRLEAWATTRDQEGVIAIANRYNYSAIPLGFTKKMDKPSLTMTFEDLNETVTFKSY